VGRDPAALVAEQVLTIFERQASRAKPPAECVLQIVDPHSAKAIGRFDSGLLLPLVRGANTCVLPRRRVHAR
jgi:hypothetical protein